jgi:hypothetical protein
MSNIKRVCCECKHEVGDNNEALPTTEQEIIKEIQELQAFFHKPISLCISHGYCRPCFDKVMKEIDSNT